MELCTDSRDRFCSHPDKYLSDHLKEVGESARENIITAGRPDLSDLAYTAGLLHDIGKYTDEFQRHLRTGKKVPCSDHALVSSLIAYGEARSLRPGDDITSHVYPLLTMLAVLSHHTGLKGLTTVHDLLRNKGDELENDSCLKTQLGELSDRWGFITSEIGVPLHVRPSADLLSQAEKSVFKVRGYVAKRAEEKAYSWKWYFEGLLLFSSLIDADKHSASGTEYLRHRPLDPDPLIRYAEGLPKSGKVYPMREQLFNFAKGYTPSGPLTFLNAPTGSGKTISGTVIGLKHGMRRLIYSLPFINIIEQTYNVLHSVYGDDVMRFHHLSYPEPKGHTVTGEEYKDMEKELLTAESWDSPLIVTTFEALVNTLLSSRNAYLKRLHNTANSFLLLDEVQAMGVEELYIVKEALEGAVKELNIKALFMTATNPFWQGLRPVDSTPNRYKVTFRDLDTVVRPEDVAQEVCGKKDVMVEFNTIDSAERGFRSLKECTDDVYFLSTRVVPKQRIERVEEIIRKKKKGEGVALVTTQLIEAGVDVDFREAVRDLGPIDSIIQAAGRVNREWRRDKGELTVVRVKRESANSTDFSLVYGKLTEEITLSALSGVREVEEKDVDGLLSKYYEEIRKKFKPESSRKRAEVLGNVTKLEFDKVELKLITEEPKYTVYVTLDEEAEEVDKQVKKALNERGYQRRAKVKALMARAQSYVVKVWEKPDLSLDDELEWYVLERGDIDKFYDPNTGFKAKVDESALIW